MTTSESFVQQPPQVETWEDRMWDTLQDNANILAHGNGEEGFVTIGYALGKKAVKFFYGSWERAVATSASTLLVGTTIFGGFLEAREIHGGADLDKAKTSSEAKALAFNKKRELKLADFYFTEKFTARDIPYSIDWKPALFDVIPDYKENKELNGVGKCRYTIPFTAVTPAYNESSKKTDYTIDKKALQLDCSWVETPVIKDFVMDGTTRKYSANGFKSNTVKNISEQFTHFRIDNFKNAVNDIDMLAGRAITNKALEVSGDKCSEKLDTHLETAAKEMVIDNVESLGQKGTNVGDVDFVEGKWVLNHEQLPAVVQTAVNDTYKHNRNIVVNQNFTVDNIQCDVNEKDLEVK
jgi:hypothetical protein